MSDPKEGGTPCNYSVPLDAFNNSAGGTSFTAPQFASIQALINQKAGGPQGNPAMIYYDLAASEFGGRNNPKPSVLAKCNANDGNKSGEYLHFPRCNIGEYRRSVLRHEQLFPAGPNTIRRAFRIRHNAGGSVFRTKGLGLRHWIGQPQRDELSQQLAVTVVHAWKGRLQTGIFNVGAANPETDGLPDHWRESYVCETGKSMKAVELAVCERSRW
jgi:hypothetical protein